MLTFHRRRSGLRRDEMAAQMSASGLKQAGSMTVITKSKQMRSNDRLGIKLVWLYGTCVFRIIQT